MPLIFSPESGEAIVGSERLSFVPAGDDGSVRLAGPSGRIIRPLRFGERTRLLLDALQADDPPAFCSDLLAHAATNSPADVLSPGEKVLALVLAGGEIEAPPLSRTVAVVAVATGWPQEIINEKMAIEIDRMACDLTSRDQGWKKIVFPGQGADDVEAIIGELTAFLLNRTDEGMIRLLEEGRPPGTAAEGTGGEPPAAESGNPFGTTESYRNEPSFSPSDRSLEGQKPPARHISMLQPLGSGPGTLDDPHPPEAHRQPSPASLSAASPSRQHNRGGDDPRKLTRRENRESFFPEGSSGWSAEGKGYDLRNDRCEALSPAEEGSPEGMMPVKRKMNPARNAPLVPQPPQYAQAGLNVQRSAQRAAAGRPVESEAAGSIDGAPLRRVEINRLAGKGASGPGNGFDSMTDILPAGGGADRTPEAFEASPKTELRSSLPENRTAKESARSSTVAGPPQTAKLRSIQDFPAPGIPAAPDFPVPGRVNGNRERDLLSALNALDSATLADEIGRLLAVEADLRGID